MPAGKFGVLEVPLSPRAAPRGASDGARPRAAM